MERTVNAAPIRPDPGLCAPRLCLGSRPVLGARDTGFHAGVLWDIELAGVAAFGLRRVQSLVSGSRELTAIVRRDPEHVPERLALFAVHRLGEPSRLWAREALTDGADPGVVATKLRRQLGRVARIDGAISGRPFFLALGPGYLGYLREEAMMVLRAAALYGHDPRARSPPKCSRCVASIQTVGGGVRDRARQRDPLPDKPKSAAAGSILGAQRHNGAGIRLLPIATVPPGHNRPHAKLLAAVGLMLGVAVWLFTWVFPVTFMVVMAWSCERDGRHMGRKVRDSYGGEAATTEAETPAWLRAKRQAPCPAPKLVERAELIVRFRLPRQPVECLAEAFATPVLCSRKLSSAQVLHAKCCVVRVPRLEPLIPPPQKRALAQLPGERRVPGHREIRRHWPAAKGRTQTSVRRLSRAERVDEIARMLGGIKVGSAQRRAAAEMLKDS